MKTFLISFRLNNNNDYTTLTDVIHTYEKWAKVFDFTWIIRTNEDALSIRAKLTNSINNNGAIMVMDITNDGWATYAVSQEVTNWMKSNV